MLERDHAEEKGDYIGIELTWKREGARPTLIATVVWRGREFEVVGLGITGQGSFKV